MAELVRRTLRAALPTEKPLRVSCASASTLKATTEGTMGEPSSPGMTTGVSPCMKAMRELVVPRSMPTTGAVVRCCVSATDPLLSWARVGRPKIQDQKDAPRTIVLYPTDFVRDRMRGRVPDRGWKARRVACSGAFEGRGRGGGDGVEGRWTMGARRLACAIRRGICGRWGV